MYLHCILTPTNSLSHFNRPTMIFTKAERFFA